MKYRKKPAVFDAFQPAEILKSSWPTWLLDARRCGELRTLVITGHDYIVRASDGFLFVVTAEDFEATYEAVTDEFQAGFARGVQEGPRRQGATR